MPVLAEGFGRMFSTAGAIAAHQCIGRAVLVATPADALGVLGVKGKFFRFLHPDMVNGLAGNGDNRTIPPSFLLTTPMHPATESGFPFSDHFSRVSDAYADFRPTYPPALFDWLAGIAPATGLAWDCACGSGQASVDLAARFRQVVATDASAAQLAGAVVHERVIYREAPAEASGLPEGSVDLVTVAQALHWFDRPRFYAEVARVLKPGGILAVWSYGVQTVEGEAVDAVVQHYYREVVGPYWPPERRLVEEGYRSLDLPFDEFLAPHFEMSVHWPLERLLGYFASWSATGRYLKATGENPVLALAERLAPVWGEGVRRVTWPLAVRVARK
jgi:SAM-dependent methyltransferase